MAATLHAALVEKLGADASVAALVSTRIYHHQAPQGTTLPYITFFVVSSEHVRSLGSRVQVVRQVVQIDCWADNSVSSTNLREAVQLALDAFRGSMGATAALRVLGAFLQTTREMKELPSVGEETVLYRSSLDFAIWHEED